MDETYSQRGEWNQGPSPVARTPLLSARKRKAHMMDSVVYWFVLAISIFGNFIISIILIPFLVALEGVILYIIIAVIAFAFGGFFDLLIRDIQRINNSDLIIAGLFLPLLATINVWIIVQLSNEITTQFSLGTHQQNPFLIAAVYVFFFVMPYVLKTSVRMGSMVSKERF